MPQIVAFLQGVLPADVHAILASMQQRVVKLNALRRKDAGADATADIEAALERDAAALKDACRRSVGAGEE